MSRDNVEIVHSLFDAFGRGDTESILERVDPTVVVVQPAELGGTTQHGHAGILEAFAFWPEQWEDFGVDILRTVDVAEHVIVTTRNSGRSKDSGIEVTNQFSFVFTFDAGRLVRWRIFVREQEALDAVGLAE